MNNSEAHSYRVFGLSVTSEMLLPELVPARPVPFPDVVIRIGQASATRPSAELTIGADKASLTVDGVASYAMLGGKTIIVTPCADVSERNVRLYLMGSAFAAILHQRGLFPLHSNAIAIDGHAVAFMGHAGAGKSTLAAWFHDRGFGILSDDVCVVSMDEPGSVIAQAGLPRLRLWRDALEASGRTVDDQEVAFDDWEKYNLRADNGASLEAMPLSHLYLLSGDGSPGVEGMITRLSGSRAAQVVFENTYRGAYVRSMGATRRHFEQCVQLARERPIFVVQRPWGLDVMDAVGTRLEEHARSIIRATKSER